MKKLLSILALASFVSSSAFAGQVTTDPRVSPNCTSLQDCNDKTALASARQGAYWTALNQNNPASDTYWQENAKGFRDAYVDREMLIQAQNHFNPDYGGTIPLPDFSPTGSDALRLSSQAASAYGNYFRNNYGQSYADAFAAAVSTSYADSVGSGPVEPPPVDPPPVDPPPGGGETGGGETGAGGTGGGTGGGTPPTMSLEGLTTSLQNASIPALILGIGLILATIFGAVHGVLLVLKTIRNRAK